MKAIINRCFHRKTLIIKGCEYCQQCGEVTGQQLFKFINDYEQLRELVVKNQLDRLARRLSTSYPDANQDLSTVDKRHSS